MEQITEKRLGYISSESVINHPFFYDVDFNNIYKGYGPYYPQKKYTKFSDDGSSNYKCFNQLSESEALEVPNFLDENNVSTESEEWISDEFVNYTYYNI